MKNVIIISFIIQILISQILSQGDDCNCSDLDGNGNKDTCNNCPNCRFYNNGDKCISCQNLSSKPYYIFSGTSEISCETIKEKTSTDNYKLIFNTYNIVEECPSTYTLIEDICYSENDLNILNAINDKKCPKYYYIKKIKDGFNYFECSNKCPNGYDYYDDTTGKCLQTCDKYIKKISSVDGTFIYRCSDNCLSDGSEFKYEDNSTSNTKKYCLEQCPKEAKFYYTTDYKCLTNCNENDYSKEDICSNSCSSGIILVNLNKKIFSCSQEGTSCPLDYPYIYEKTGNSYTYCLKSCQDTKDKYFGTDGNNGETTYFDDETKKCLSNKEGYFIDLNTLKWVSDCKKSSSGPYTNGNLCQSSCPDKVQFDTLKCITSCDSNSDYRFSIEDSYLL